MTRLDADTASRFAGLTLGHLGQEYPNKLDHVFNSDTDALPPRVLHPAFYGSFDWHSCVHGWWQVLTLARHYPDLDIAANIRTRADRMLTPTLIAQECAYLDRPGAGGFERTYGWAWALALHGEAVRHAAGWGDALAPLATAFAERFRTFLPKLTYPIRTGTHANTAFSLIFAHDWAREHDAALARLITERAHEWFSDDRACQAWEPGGDEFLSPALCEALLMSRVLDRPAFARWFTDFLPEVGEGRPETLFLPATVSDRSDGKIAHLDGLNLSRAWCWREIAAIAGDDHPVAALARAAAERHLQASLPHIDDDYMGTHWLATFALLALTAGQRAG